MFTLNNNTEFRNLEEQVQKNKEDIAKHYEIDRAMSNLGIKVVGQIDSAQLLPNPLTYAGEYGDTYAVGVKSEVQAGTATYDYYVFTRPDINSGQPNNYWLNVGKISIEGPIGPVGPEGPQGPEGKSSKWFTGEFAPDSNVNVGDMYLNNQGEVFQYNGTNWVPTTNIKGPQGIQGIQGLKGERGEQGPVGPQGPQGDVGGFINIWGILSSTSQLPTPTELNNLSVAYLVEHTGGNDQANDHYDLYIQVGATVGEAVWSNVGPFNAATLVTSGGVGLNVFDADTKVDKVNTAFKLYGTKDGGTQTTYSVGWSANANIVPIYDRSNLGGYDSTGEVSTSVTGAIKTAIPEKPDHATPKKYVDDIAATKVDKFESDNANRCLYGMAPDGSPLKVYLQSGTTANRDWWVPVYHSTWGETEPTGEGRLISKDPIQPYQLATKHYVDVQLATVPTTQKYMHNLSIQTSNKATMLNIQFMSTSNTPIQTRSELYTEITNFLTTGRYPISGVVQIETTRYVATYIYIDKGFVYIMGTSGIGTSTISTNFGLLENIITGQYTISDKVF